MSIITVNDSVVSSHKSAIGGHESNFNATASPVTGGTALAIPAGDENRTTAIAQAERSGTVFPRITRGIETVANGLRQCDANLARFGQGG